MSKLLPILLLVLGLCGGAGAGFLLRPAAVPEPQIAEGDRRENRHGGGQDTVEGGHDRDDADAAVDAYGHYAPAAVETETIRLPNQFVVPLIEEGRVQAMVVIGLALELETGHDFVLTRNEPRIRAVFLQLLFDHANIGGFTGIFTSGEALLSLRRILRDAARAEIGPEVHDILITELMRQES